MALELEVTTVGPVPRMEVIPPGYSDLREQANTWADSQPEIMGLQLSARNESAGLDILLELLLKV